MQECDSAKKQLYVLLILAEKEEEEDKASFALLQHTCKAATNLY
jgi:hypothetical protein